MGRQANGGRGRGEGAFRSHLAIYLVMAVFFLALNLLTGPGELWFYWPVFFWGFALVLQAFATFGAEAPTKVAALLRSFVPGSARPQRPATPSPVAPIDRRQADPARDPLAVAPVTDEAEARVARLWRAARLIPVPAARDQAFRVVAAADRVAEVMAADKTDPQTVAWFIEHYLVPTEAILERYARLAGRGVAAAEPALATVEHRDLPLLETRLTDLYEQLHRGDVIDLQVASEMLDLDLDAAPPKPPRHAE